MQNLNILILFYSLTGGTAKLAEAVAAGARDIPNTTVTIKRIPELMPAQMFDQKPDLKKIKQDLEAKYPEATLQDLIDSDGVAFGTPVHFGSFASQVKQFLDQLSPVWLEGRLVDKPAAVFCSAGTMHGGEEATLISLMIPLLNLGMLPVGLPYTTAAGSATFDSASPYGAIAVANHTTPGTAEAAGLLGKRLAKLTHQLCQTQSKP